MEVINFVNCKPKCRFKQDNFAEGQDSSRETSNLY